MSANRQERWAEKIHDCLGRESWHGSGLVVTVPGRDGQLFVVYGEGDTIVLKRIKTPDAEEM